MYKGIIKRAVPTEAGIPYRPWSFVVSKLKDLKPLGAEMTL